MKFVDVNPFFFPYKGGIERRMHDTSRLLAARGHDVTVLTSRLPDTPEEETTEWGYRILRLPSKFLNVYNPPYVSSKGIADALSSLNPDCVNYNYRWAPSYNHELKKYDGRKVFTYHNMWGEGTGIDACFSKINDEMFRSTLDAFDSIVCVSDRVRDDLTKRGIAESKTITIPTCIDLPPFPEPREDDYILSFGRLVKTKGVEYLVEAMRYVDCKLIICGTGPEENRLRKRISALGLETRIEMRGYVPDEERDSLIDSCKMFVMPSLRESFGLAALEVTSRGKPVVFSTVDGLPETVGDGGIGVPPRNPEMIADAINTLIEDDALRGRKGIEARRRAEHYSWDKHLNTLESVLRGTVTEERVRNQ